LSPKWSNRFELKPGRWVFVPTVESVETGRQIKKALEVKWKAPAYYYHLRDGGHVAALKAHLGQSAFLHLDIHNFFGSINKTRVTRCLRPIVGYKRARDWAIASTVPDPFDFTRLVLPYGFVQSTLIASICLRDSALGRCLHFIAHLPGVRVSVYVDDLIISTNDSDGATKLHEQLRNSATRSRFKLNSEKEQGPALEIDAFNVRLSSAQLQLTETRLERFREVLAHTQTTVASREAILSYIASINESQARAMAVSNSKPA
jgi:hypothetical protein